MVASLKEFGSVPFGHEALLSVLSGYKRPNDKIVEWIKSGVLIPLKRGLYVLGQSERDGGLSLPLLANRIYGPSCVSLEYALAWWGLIPERVHEVTSVSFKRSRVFENAIATFSYVTVPKSVFSIGLKHEVSNDSEAFLIAGAEKALCDKVLVTRNLNITSKLAMREFLFDDLRIDETYLSGFDQSVIEQYIKAGCKARVLKLLLSVLESYS